MRVLGKSNLDHLLVLASDFDTLEFVFLDKRKKEQKGPASGERNARSFPRRSASAAATRPGWTCARCGGSPGPARTLWTSSTSSAASSTPPPTPANTSRTGACSPTTSCGTACEKTRPGGTTRPSCSPLSAISCGTPRLAGAARTRKPLAQAAARAALSASSASRPRSTGPARPNQTQPDYLLNEQRRQAS